MRASRIATARRGLVKTLHQQAIKKTSGAQYSVIAATGLPLQCLGLQGSLRVGVERYRPFDQVFFVRGNHESRWQPPARASQPRHVLRRSGRLLSQSMPLRRARVTLWKSGCQLQLRVFRVPPATLNECMLLHVDSVVSCSGEGCRGPIQQLVLSTTDVPFRMLGQPSNLEQSH